jgi:hypothetical protein
MADEQIKASDLVSPELVKELQNVNKELQNVIKSTQTLLTTMKPAFEEMRKGADTQAKLHENTKKTEETTRKLSDVEKEIEKIEEKHYQVLTKMVAERSEENKKLEQATDRRKKENLERRAEIQSVEGLTAKNKLLRAERDKLILTDKNYTDNLKKLNAQIEANDKTINKAKDAEQQRIIGIGKYENAWKGVTETFGKVVGIFALFGITTSAFHKVLESSRTQLEKYEAMMTGIEFASKTFFKTLRTGAPDMSTFIESLAKAYERGVKYQEGLDLIEKRQKAINFVRGEEKQKLAELDEAIRDKTKSNDERLKAGLEVEERLNKGYEQEKELRKQNVKIELEALNIKGKTIEQAKEIIKQYLREDAFQPQLREDAEKLNKILSEKEQTLKNINASVAATRDERAKEGGRKQAEDLKKEIDLIKNRNDSTGKYATLIRELEGERGKGRVDKSIEAIQKETDAENAFYYENKRIINTVNGLKESASDDDKKRKENELKDSEEIAKNELAILKKQWKEMGDFYTQNEKDIKDQAKINEQIQDETQKNYLDRKKSEEDADKRTWDKKKQIIEAEKKAREESQKIAIESANSLFDITANLGAAQIANLEANRDKELLAAGNNAKQKERIEADYNKKIGDIKRKQAIADKVQALFNIAINTQVAVSKTLATTGWLGIPLTTWIKIQGALQAAAVLSAPIPKFFKGVKGFKGGLATVGEQGAELIETRQGEMFLTPSTATTMALPKGSNVYTKDETINMLSGMDSDMVDILIKEQRLTRKALANQTHNSTTLTQDGLEYARIKGNSRTVMIDKYFRT